MINNPFKPESKSYKVIELVNKGKTHKEIAKTMKYKYNNYVSAVIHRAKLKNLANVNNPEIKAPPGSETQGSDNTGDLIPRGALITSLPPGDLVKRPIADLGRNVVQIEGFAPSRYIALTPKNITLIQWFTAKFGYEGDLSDFINDAVEDFFQSRNYQLKIIKEEIIQ